jgi:hypothetical protein
LAPSGPRPGRRPDSPPRCRTGDLSPCPTQATLPFVPYLTSARGRRRSCSRVDPDGSKSTPLDQVAYSAALKTQLLAEEPAGSSVVSYLPASASVQGGRPPKRRAAGMLCGPRSCLSDGRNSSRLFPKHVYQDEGRGAHGSGRTIEALGGHSFPAGGKEAAPRERQGATRFSKPSEFS